jgi:hypothetical protein
MRSLTPKQVLNRLYASGTLCILFDYLLCFVAAATAVFLIYPIGQGSFSDGQQPTTVIKA